MGHISGKHLVRITCTTLVLVILVYLLVLAVVALIQSVSDYIMPFSVVYTIAIPLLLLSICCTCAMSFNYCPKRLLSKQLIYIWFLFLVLCIVLIYMIIFFAYCIYSNYSVMQSLLTGNIIDPNNILLAEIAIVKQLIIWNWLSFALSLFGLATSICLFVLRIKN